MSAQSREISRRRFIASAGLTATAVCLVPYRVFGAEENLVAASRKAGETANITVQALRGNISALIDCGGNIAVLPGGDGKVIIDSGFLGTRSKIADDEATDCQAPGERVAQERPETAQSWPQCPIPH